MRKPGTSAATTTSQIALHLQRPGLRTEKRFRKRSKVLPRADRLWYVDHLKHILVHVLTGTQNLFDGDDSESRDRERLDALSHDDLSLMGEIGNARKKIFQNKHVLLCILTLTFLTVLITLET